VQFAPEFELRAGSFGLLGGAPIAVRRLAPPALGLIAAACLAWVLCPAPPAHWLTWRQLFVTSALYVAAVLAISTAATVGAYATLGGGARSRIRAIQWSTPVAAAWFAPLAVWCSEQSGWAVVAAMVLAAYLTSQLMSGNGTAQDPGESRLPYGLLPDAIFRSPLVEPMTGALLLPLCCALLLQVACAASSMGHVGLAAVFAAIATAAIVSRADFAMPTRATRPVLRTAAIVAVAVICTAAGLARYLNHARPFDSEEPGKSSMGGNASRRPPSDLEHQSVPKLKSRTSASSAVVGSTFPGIILTPEEQPQSQLVPPLPAMQPTLFSARHATPLSIPFFGVYWLFRAPDTHPPENSLQARGSPAEHTFRSTDHRPLIAKSRLPSPTPTLTAGRFRSS